MADALYDSVISGLTDAPVQFGLIPSDHWNQPPWIDEDKASAARDEMTSKNVMYGGKCSYNPSPFFQIDVTDRLYIVSELRLPRHEC